MIQYTDLMCQLIQNCKYKTITFQITNDCTCNCSYCYQINKKQEYMDKDTAKQCVDLLFDLYYKNGKNEFINMDTDVLILDFIGGEPLLNIEIIDFICSYFLERCINEHHPWIHTVRFSICSNGDLYFSEKVQKFLKKFKDFLSFTITIDGPEEIHNECRKHKDGSGNFLNAFNAWTHYHKTYLNEPTTKITIAPENLNKISLIADFFIKNNAKFLAINPAYEPKWTIKNGQEYYNQLKIIANKLLENNIDNNLFEINHFIPINENDLRPWCGGYGEMLAFDPNGIAYPCIRFMASSLGEEVKPIVIGNCTNGIYNTKDTIDIKKQFEKINRKTENNEECYNCPIGHGCGECAAWSYQSAGGVLGIRNTNICNMHKARYLANAYYWNKYYEKNNIDKHFDINLPREECLKFISEDEYNLIK